MNYYDSHDVENGDKMYFDAIYISPHKFVGGPGTPGLLIMKRDIYKASIPTVPGGGTVTFVSRLRQEYHHGMNHLLLLFIYLFISILLFYTIIYLFMYIILFI